MLTPITAATISYVAGIVLGRFLNIEELKEVPGISVKKLEMLKKYIIVNKLKCSPQ
jgi:hypothetical protein